MAERNQHNRKCVINTTDLVKFRFGKLPASKAMAAQQEVGQALELLMAEADFLSNAPFDWVGPTIRHGLRNEDQPHLQGIDKKYRILELAIEIDTHEIINADREELKRKYMIAGLKALIGAGKKYNLPTELFEQRLRELQALDQ